MVTEPTDDEVAVIAAHFQYLVDLKERGDLILAGRTQEADGTFGITIFEAADEDAARAIMEGDPAVAAGRHGRDAASVRRGGRTRRAASEPLGARRRTAQPRT